MKSMMLLLIVSALSASLSPARAENIPPGKVVDTQLLSRHLQGDLIGIDPERQIKVYLPPGYDRSKRSYPVIYYFHSMFWSARQMFADGVVIELAGPRHCPGHYW